MVPARWSIAFFTFKFEYVEVSKKIIPNSAARAFPCSVVTFYIQGLVMIV